MLVEAEDLALLREVAWAAAMEVERETPMTQGGFIPILVGDWQLVAAGADPSAYRLEVRQGGVAVGVLVAPQLVAGFRNGDSALRRAMKARLRRALLVLLEGKAPLIRVQAVHED